MINDLYSFVYGVDSVQLAKMFLVDDDLPGVGLDNSRDYLNERGFSRSILPNETVDFTLVNGNAHIIQCLNTGIGFTDIFQ